MDGCKDCIRCHEYELEVCHKCGQKMVEVKLDGPCLCKKCMNCDFEVIGTSFYAPCELDDRKYKIAVDGMGASNKLIMDLSAICKISALEARRVLQEHEPLRKEFWLFELPDIVQRIEEIGLKYSVESELEYSKFFFCERKLMIHRI